MVDVDEGLQFEHDHAEPFTPQSEDLFVCKLKSTN